MGELAGEAGCQPEFVQCDATIIIFLSGAVFVCCVVCVLCVKRSTVFITSVKGGAREPQSGFPDGAGGGVELFYGWARAGVEVMKSL